ncbi:MAG: lipopolysaccharide heptosyltransferase I [Methylophilus sp.]|nr:lipopolysaccharide heptosyltransferase I [Methylophilus sp.]
MDFDGTERIVCENIAMKRILLVKTSSLGDVIHNLPVVNDLLQHYPDAKIDWIVEESFADIPALHPSIHNVKKVAVRRWRKQLLRCNTWQEIRAFKQSLDTHYDAVIDTQGLIKSALISRMAHGAKHGYDQHSIREPLASRAYQHTYAISYQQHAVTRNRTLVAQALGYTVPTHHPDYGIQAHTTQFPVSMPLPKSFVIGLHGTSRDSKLWPTECWITLGKQLEAEATALVLPWASQAEKQRAEQIQSQLSHAIVLPKLNIGQLATIIAQARVAIGVDTGLSHLAVALSIPTIAIYTDTDPALTGVLAGAFAPAINLGNQHEVPTTDEVFNAYQQLIERAP